MPIETSQGKRRVTNHRLPRFPKSAISAPDHDPKTGRFVKGNRAGRRKRRDALIKAGKTLSWFDAEQVEVWLRPLIEDARNHASQLISELHEQTALLAPMCEELASARLIYRGLLSMGIAGDKVALREARSWLRECRSLGLAVEGLNRTATTDPPEDNRGLTWLIESEAEDQPSPPKKSTKTGPPPPPQCSDTPQETEKSGGDQ